MRAYIDGPDGQIHYQMFGEGKPLLLCHQAPTCSVQFQAVLHPLADKGFKVIAIDNPGFGMSDGPSAPPSIEREYLNATMAVMDALKIERAHIAGHHTGSMLAVEAANRYPQRFDKVVLHGPLLLEAEELPQWRANMVPKEEALGIPSADGSHLSEAWNWRASHARQMTAVAAINRHILWQAMAGEKSWYGHHACFNYDQIASVRQLRQPCLMLTNTGDLVHDISSRIRTIRPDIDVIEFKGGSMDFIDEHPEQWIEAVTAFLIH